MQKGKVTQGSIIYGVRSNKYCGVPCRGIIVSARCDLEWRKIPTVYLLSALTVEQWFNQSGIREATAIILNDKKGTLKKSLKNNGLSFSLLETFTEDEIRKVINAEVKKKKDRTSILQQLEDYIKWKTLHSAPSIPEDEKYNKLIQDKAKEILSGMLSGGNSHMCFIPSATYESKEIDLDIRDLVLYLEHTKDKSSTYYAKAKALLLDIVSESNTSVHIISHKSALHAGQGLIVDLQDLVSYPAEDMDNVIENQYDGMILSEKERSELNEKYFLESREDFVQEEGCIKSPWVEWLLQRFCLSFMRIGVDDIKKDSVNEFFDQIISEG